MLTERGEKARHVTYVGEPQVSLLALYIVHPQIILPTHQHMICIMSVTYLHNYKGGLDLIEN